MRRHRSAVGRDDAQEQIRLEWNRLIPSKSVNLLIYRGVEHAYVIRNHRVIPGRAERPEPGTQEYQVQQHHA
ncbi:hypothetical protein CHELA40_50440 [Chelatococcus asaccharovorans]|nr:hypothetical protein CHELA17_20405 [Chelatococcus asaccharovorans]CAH1692839.1 hypothetical protein CHELA40_50440 [Chelatococcus asaccharovorans]